MRRTNLRKKKRVMIQESNKKSLKILFALTAIIILALIVYVFFIQNIFIKSNFEKDNIEIASLNENIPFSIKKIILFSSATANAENVNQSLLNLDISQYCDIGIYLNNSDIDNNIIQALYIDNISISTPELGSPCLYMKRVTDLGKCSFDEKNIINQKLDFNIIDINSDINYDNLEMYSNASTPISIGFYNRDVKKDYLTDLKEIIYNGTLLKKAAIPVKSLECNVSFTINIITTSNEHYICNISFDVPLQDGEGSIADTGYAIMEINTANSYKFLRIK